MAKAKNNKKAERPKKAKEVKPAKIPNKVGRPTDYSKELAEEICDTISITSKGLYHLCKENSHWPVPQTIRKWKRKIEEFNSMYVQAKQDQADFLAEECLTIADDITHDSLTKYDSNGEPYEVANTEYINRSRLRVDTRKWMAAKLLPKTYGDKMLNEHSGPNGTPIEYAQLTPEERNNRIAEILATARARRADEAHSGDREGDAEL